MQILSNIMQTHINVFRVIFQDGAYFLNGMKPSFLTAMEIGAWKEQNNLLDSPCIMIGSRDLTMKHKAAKP
jgi:hypothetical protein